MTGAVGRSLAAAMTAAAVAAAAGCGSSDAGDKASGDTLQARAERGMTIGFAQPTSQVPGAREFAMGLRCYAVRMGGKVKVVDANTDLNKQLNDFNALLAQKVDAIAVLPLDPRAFAGAYAKAEDQQVPVVELFNPDTRADIAVLEPAAQYGQDAVRRATAAVGAKAKAVIIDGPPVENIKARVEGFKVAAAAAGVTIAGTVHAKSGTTDEGRQLADQLLSKTPGAKIVFAFDENLAVGAGLAAKARGLEGVQIIGVGASAQTIDAVRRGLVTVAYDVQAYEDGVQAAKLLERLARGQAVEPYTSPIKAWTKDDVASWKPVTDRGC